MQRFKMLLVGTLLCVCGSHAFSENGLDTLHHAANDGKYTYFLFYKDDSSNSVRLQGVFNQAVQKLGNRVQSATISLTDPTETAIVEKFDVKRAPMPLALVIAPNGAVMGGFPSAFTEEQLINAMASSGAADCLKALQERKLVFLCLQNDRTTDNEAALQGVNDFKKDARFNNASQVVMLDPSNADEQRFLKQLGVDSQGMRATTVMIVPPGDIVGQYQGATNKESLVSDLMNATSKSCCPGGCCPGGCCSPR